MPMNAITRPCLVASLLLTALFSALALPAFTSAYSYYPGGYGGQNNYTNHTFAPYTYVNTMPVVNVNATAYANASSQGFPALIIAVVVVSLLGSLMLWPIKPYIKATR